MPPANSRHDRTGRTRCTRPSSCGRSARLQHRPSHPSHPVFHIGRIPKANRPLTFPNAPCLPFGRFYGQFCLVRRSRYIVPLECGPNLWAGLGSGSNRCEEVRRPKPEGPTCDCSLTGGSRYGHIPDASRRPPPTPSSFFSVASVSAFQLLNSHYVEKNCT